MAATEDIPSTLRRSSKKAQDTYVETHDSAVEEYGEGERAHRTAFASVKHSFEKVGDHWEPKEKKGPSDAKAAGGRATRAKTAGGVDANALGRGHYRRYDEGTAPMLGDAARLCRERRRGDLRRLHGRAGSDTGQLRALLIEFPGIGPTGADIFLREVQGVWPDIAPYVDRKVVDGAKRMHLPTAAGDLAGLAPGGRLPVMLSALVRVGLDREETS